MVALASVWFGVVLLDKMSDWAAAPFWLIAAFLAAIALAMPVIVRRLHDLNVSAAAAWFFGFGFRLLMAAGQAAGLGSRESREQVGLVLLALAGLCLAAAPGTAGENRFGCSPRWPRPSPG